MNNSTHPASFVRKPARGPLSRNEEIVAGLFFGLLLFLGSFLALYIGTQIWYLGRILPGVSLAGVSLDGLSTSEAASKIGARVNYANNGHLLLYDSKTQKNWSLTPSQLGLLLDPDASARAAMQVGRSPSPLKAMSEQFEIWISGRDLAPVYIFDQRLSYTMLSQISSQVNQPVVNAGITVKGTEVTETTSQNGRLVDIPATIELIQNKAQTMQDAAIPLVIKEEVPTVLDVSEQAKQVRQVLSQPLTLTLSEGITDKDGTSSYIIPADVLATMLSFENVTENDKTTLKASLSSQSLLSYLSPLASKIQADTQNSRFTFNDSTKKLDLVQSAVIGHSLNLQKSVVAINQQVFSGSHAVALQVDLEKPKIGDDTVGADLGIIEEVHEEISFFYDSPAERVQNIKAASKSFNGLLVAPGETLSMSAVMGDVSLDTGYSEALIIANGQTIKGVGGGVCQVSTTLFRAAFFSGFQVVERYPHAYRVGYYEYDLNGRHSDHYAGLDATVYVPYIDFKFKNDSSTWLLMETYVNPTYGTLVWKFYGTKDGRTVDWTTSGLTNVVKHPDTLYRENKDLPAGEVKKVDYAADGADVKIHRVVRKDGVILHDDEFDTHYQPWQAIFEYGPGTEGMPPADNGTD
jgi:vancomycin resistance protein YoaR